jgi:hypothetical protein
MLKLLTAANVPAYVPKLSIPHAGIAPVIHQDINDLHYLLGHADFDSIKRSAEYHNIKLIGEPKTCVSCALAKIHQKNITSMLTLVEPFGVVMEVPNSVSSLWMTTLYIVGVTTCPR